MMVRIEQNYNNTEGYCALRLCNYYYRYNNMIICTKWEIILNYLYITEFTKKKIPNLQS